MAKKTSRAGLTTKAAIPDPEVQKDLKTFWKDQRSSQPLDLNLDDPKQPKTVLKGHAGFTCPGLAPDGDDANCHGTEGFQFLTGGVALASASVVSLYCPKCKRSTRIEKDFFAPVLKADLEVRQLELVAEEEVAAIEAEDAPMDMTEVEEILDEPEA